MRSRKRPRARSCARRSRRARFPPRRSAPRSPAVKRRRSEVCFPRSFWPILNAIVFILKLRMRLNRLQKTAVNALEDIKAHDITVLDVRKLTSLYDTLIVASGNSARQVKSLAAHV